MTPVRFAILLLVCTAWGLHFPVIKSTIGGVDPIFYAVMRMSLVALILAPLLRWHHGQMARVLMAGVFFGGLNYACMFSGLKYLPASIGAILIEFYVPIAMVFSIIFLNEKVGWRRVFGGALAFAGVMVILSGGDTGLSEGDSLVLGGIFILGAATSEAAGAILIKKIDGVSPLRLLAWFALVGSIVTLFLSAIFERDQFAFLNEEARSGILWAVLYSAVVASIIGHSSYYWLLQRLDVSQVAPAGLMTTVIAVAGGVFLLDETFSFRLAMGALVTMTGVAIIVFRSAQKATQKEAVPLPVVEPTGLTLSETGEGDDEPAVEDDTEGEKKQIDALYD